MKRLIGFALLLLAAAAPVGAQNYLGSGSGGVLNLPDLNGAGNAGNFIQDGGSTWGSVALSQDLACAVSGVCTVSGWNTVPLVGNLTSSTANQTYITNSSNQLVPARIPVDPNTTVGQIAAVSATGTPNTYSAVTPGAQGTLMTSAGATSLPVYSKNNAPLWIDFPFDGSVTSSEARIRVCPVTMNAAPGFVAAYPYPASQATIGTNPGETDTYTLTDVTNSNTVIGTAAVTSGGAWTFATSNCSAGFDGTQGSTAWARIASAGTTAPVVIPSGAVGGDGAILGCFSGSNGGFTAPTGVTGWSAVTNGAASGSTSSIQLYEKILGSSDHGQTVNCNNSNSAGMSAMVITVKNVPNGEIVDIASAVRGGSATTIAATGITPNHNGELIIQGAMTGSNVTVSSWSPANTNVATTVAGVGAQYLVQGTAGATGTATATWSSAAVAGAFQLAFLNSATSCPLCTAGDQMKLQVGTVTLAADANIKFEGALP